MAEQAMDLWPQIEAVDVRTPGTILKQQAALLGKHTKNLLEGRVLTQGRAGLFIHHFMIDAPTLNYSMELFAVSHDLKLYPVRIEEAPSVRLDLPPGSLLNSEVEFVDWLKAVFNAAETKRILSTLMAQVES
jgi:hypothetical protein